MDINALLMDESDNVATCVEMVPKDGRIVWQKGHETCSLTAEEDIPYCHKAALEDLALGAEVRKYGEMIGRTNVPIARGHLVNHENIYSVPRDYDREMLREGGTEQ